MCCNRCLPSTPECHPSFSQAYPAVSKPYDPRDPFFLKAKQENYLARSIYKLEEIDQRFHLLSKGDMVLDLGAAPGSWSQYACRRVAPKGLVLGVDLQALRCSEMNFVGLKADVFTLDYMTELPRLGLSFPLDVVLSDMAPGTTGIRTTDQARSFELCLKALELAERTLKPGGHFVCKFFDGPDFAELRKAILDQFQKVEILRPKSTRQSSKEIFLVGLKFKGGKATRSPAAAPELPPTGGWVPPP